jgi:hypothetical protein
MAGLFPGHLVLGRHGRAFLIGIAGKRPYIAADNPPLPHESVRVIC